MISQPQHNGESGIPLQKLIIHVEQTLACQQLIRGMQKIQHLVDQFTQFAEALENGAEVAW